MGSVSSLPAGERKVEGDVMVVNHKDTVYAICPKCPHLGLPMKTGKKDRFATGSTARHAR